MGVILNKVHIVNFLSHRDTTIDFHSGVNALIGISKSGKSSVMRALDWVFTNSNRPSWEALQSYWGGDILVETHWSNGNAISRGHDKDGNYYELNKLCRANGSELRAVGQGSPPEDVVRALNLNEINFQGQMDSPFLLSSNPGEVAQLLNKVVHLDVIDRATSAANKKKFELDTKRKQAVEETERLSLQLKGFDYLENMERDVVALEAVDVERKTIQAQAQRLTVLVGKVEKLQYRGWAVLCLLQAEAGINTARLHSDKIKSIRSKTETLQNRVRQIENKKVRADRLGSLLQADDDIAEAGRKLESFRARSAYITRLSTICANIESNRRRAVDKEKEYRKYEVEFERAMPNICPLCGRGE